MRKTSRVHRGLPPVCRLGLATRGNTHLRADDVMLAVEKGINYLNWCGKPDGLSRAVAALGARRKQLVVAVQFKARRAEQARREFDWILHELGSDYLDVATFYYVESQDEWQEIIAPGGAWDVLAEQKRKGRLHLIGLTSHQRSLAARWARSLAQDGTRPCHHLDLLMVRYNAAHRGAERDVFPVTRRRGMPVVTFTGLRWRALLQPTAQDPASFEPPAAPEWYRFCLAHDDIAVALAAPANRVQLEEDLRLLEDWRPPAAAEREALRRHGDRVRGHAGEFW